MRIYSRLVLLLVLGSALAAMTQVDLSPRVDNDFFFSTDDPELQASQRIDELFPSSDQLLISATAPDIQDPQYIERIEALTSELEKIEGVASVQSLTRGPASPAAVAESPIWSRLLLGESPFLTQILLFLKNPNDDESDAGETFDGQALISTVEAALERHHRAGFVLDISGVPYVIELVRRSLHRDLRVFSAAALLVFGLLIALIYRSARIVGGTLFTCLGACVTTLVLLAFLDSPIGLLTANIITIVFVLTLSHIVFLTANWRDLARNPALDRDQLSRTAVIRTLEASIWCMTTTLLGFSSLLFASAKPLRELGLAGAVGTIVALVVAFGLYPYFLNGVDRGSLRQKGAAGSSVDGDRWTRFGQPAAVATLIAVAVAIPGLGSLETDPNLLSYFAEDSELRQGLERIDQNGGSSPMLIVVSDADGGRLDTPEAQEKMSALHQTLEADPEVGTALSLPILLAEAKRAPMAFLLGWSQLLDILESPAFDNVAAGFVTPERTQGLYFMRMRESERTAPRSTVVSRLTEAVGQHGLEMDWVGGLYPLQASLGRLVEGSLMRGLGGLLALFILIAAIVSRSARVTVAMILSLVIVPVILLGALGHLGTPIDIISSPAANVAIALGIDSMIHLTTAVRRRRRQGESSPDAWRSALDSLWTPILGAAAILACGFGIFLLSSFPPTARFGSAVAVGTLIAAFAAVILLPFLAKR